jgi:hypothetical protein
MALAERAAATDPSEPEPRLFLAAKALAQGDLDASARRLDGLEGWGAGWMRRMVEVIRRAPARLATARLLLELDRLALPGLAVDRLVHHIRSSELLPLAAELLASKAIAAGRESLARATCEQMLSLDMAPPERRRFAALLERAGGVAPEASAPTTNPGPRANPPASGPETPVSAFTGDLAQFSVGELLELLRAGQKSGTLVCQRGEDLGVLQLSGGYIVDARPSLPEATPPSTSVADHGARDAISERILEVLGELVEWQDGQFVFHPQPASNAQASDGFDPQHMLLEVFRRLDEAKASSASATTSSWF